MKRILVVGVFIVVCVVAFIVGWATAGKDD